MRKKINYNFPAEEIRKELENNYSIVNIVLPKNASFSEKVKYEIAQNILSYQQNNNLTYEQTAEKLGLALSQTVEILRGSTAPFSLESLVSCLDKLHLPLKINIINEKDKLLHI